MKIAELTWAVLATVLLATFPIRLDAQEDVLQSSDPNLLALRSHRKALQSTSPFDNSVLRVTSPDVQVLDILDEAKRSAVDELGAIIDLLAVYENMQCGPDRAMLRPLLEDRLRLTSRLLELNAESAAIPLGVPSGIKLPATSKNALKLRDDLLAAKSKVDAIAASLK